MSLSTIGSGLNTINSNYSTLINNLMAGSQMSGINNMLGYFMGGGSASEVNRQKSIAQVTAPINRMIPDARVQRQNALARAGIVLPSSVSEKVNADSGTRQASALADAIAGINQQFRREGDQNRALGLQTATNLEMSGRNNILSALQGQQSVSDQMLKLEQMKFSWGDLLTSLAGSAVGMGTDLATGALSKLFNIPLPGSS